MRLEELYHYAYVKEPLDKVFEDVRSVPLEYLMDWLKDTHDYVRQHTEEELERFMNLPAKDVLAWLEDAAAFVWEANRKMYAAQQDHLSHGRNPLP